MTRRPRIFYYCYDHNRPTGGQKDTYLHVDTLNDVGYEAFALHSNEGFRLRWFTNSTPVVSMTTFRQTFDPKSDYIVLPEDLGKEILLFPGRKVIFNKNLYYGFACFGYQLPTLYPYQSSEVVAVFAMSEHNIRHLRFAYPDVRIMRVFSRIDENLFSFAPLAGKQKTIVCVPKAPASLATLYHMLLSRARAGLNSLADWQWVFLKDHTELEVATILKSSPLLVFLSVEEGLPRTPLEAMYCGCIVVGYGAVPLKECLPHEVQFEHGDLAGIARFIESLAASFPHSIEPWDALVRIGSDYAARYSAQNCRNSVISAWSDLLAGE